MIHNGKHYPDSHGAIEVNSECVVITFPVTGWYKIVGNDKEIYFKAGDRIQLGGFRLEPNPLTGDTRKKL